MLTVSTMPAMYAQHIHCIQYPSRAQFTQSKCLDNAHTYKRSQIQNKGTDSLQIDADSCRQVQTAAECLHTAAYVQICCKHVQTRPNQIQVSDVSKIFPIWNIRHAQAQKVLKQGSVAYGVDGHGKLVVGDVEGAGKAYNWQASPEQQKLSTST